MFTNITMLSDDNPLNANKTKNDPFNFQIYNEKNNTVSGNMRKKQNQGNKAKMFGSKILNNFEPESEEAPAKLSPQGRPER